MAIAKTTFVVGADESLAAVDAYGGPPQAPVSDTTSIGAARMLTLDKYLVNPVETLENLIIATVPKIKDFESLQENIKAGINKLSEIMDKPEKFFNDIKGGLIKDMVTAVGYGKQADDLTKMIMGEQGAMSPLDFLSKNNPKMKVIIDGIETVRSAKDLTDVSDLLKVIGDLSGNKDLASVLNIGPQMSVVKTLVGKAMELNIPGMTDSILDILDGDYEKALAKLHSVPLAAKYADLDFIQKVMTEFTPERVAGMAPELVNEILKHYKFPIDAVKTRDQMANDLLIMCGQLDPRWDTDTRDGVDVYSLKNMTDLSDDAKDVLMRFPKHVGAALAGDEYKSSSLVDMGRINYPYMPIV